jgi:phosphatidylglycerophosphatase C
MKTVAAFDFDNTITSKDTLLPFLYSLKTNFQKVTGSLQLIPTFVAYQCGLLDNHAAKEKLLHTFLDNMKKEAIETAAHQFAEHHLPQFVKTEALQRLRWHQSQQHICVLVSAGLAVYLTPWAEKVGFDAVLATNLSIENQKVSGKIEGKNCFGQEKVNRLLALLGDKKDFTLYAYGDSRGDKELLALADYKFYRTMPE